MAILQLDRVTKIFDRQKAVDEISFEVNRGEIFALLGGNGAGKTTTMRMVLGIIHHDEGRILWNGRGFHKELNHKMGYLPEERGLYPKIKVCDQIIYLARLRGMNAADADQQLKMWLERFQVPEYYDRRIEELSKGNQQKMQFIAAIIHRPEILVLDEAFSGLDPVNVELLKTTVKQLRDEGTCILFSTHRMEHVEELCENIVILKKSKTVLQGNLSDIKKTFPRERIILKTDAEVTGLHAINGVTQVQAKGKWEWEISIDDARNKNVAQDVLQHAANQAPIVKFELLEPTLNEIFIRSVGDDHE